MDSEAERIRVEIPVELAALGPETIAGWLSVPAGSVGRPLHLLVHGATYTHIYWDSPYQPETYSYVAWAEGQGIPTLSIDQLGAGESSRPPGDRVTLPALAEALHGVVGRARDGGVGRHRFERIVTVGHSAGSLTAGLEAVTYGDVDGVVLTGTLGPNASGIINQEPRISGAYEPASRDRVLAGRPGFEDPGYLAMRPELRIGFFYRIPPADPTLIVVDETQKDCMTTGQWATFGTAADACGRIACPTLVVNGRYDAFFYNPSVEADISAVATRAEQQAPPNYTFAPLVDDMGHNLNQHPGARDVYRQITDWAAAAIPEPAAPLPGT